MASQDDRVEIEIETDPALSAQRAGLEYVSDDCHGIRRKRWGRGFAYIDAEGAHVRDEEIRARIDALVIPPAWEDVWICTSPDGHIQVTGRDEDGRKQYIYHDRWQQVRSERKFNRLIPFAEALPTIRARAAQDLRSRGLPYRKVVAAVVTLLDRTLIRIGNRTYAQNNGSFGLTTLRDRHVDFSGTSFTFAFKGKSGKDHRVELSDPSLARIVRSCRDVPGYDLFQYYDADKQKQVVESNDVNAYLQETTGEAFTSKDFRTWGATVQAAVALDNLPAETEKEAKKNVVQMVKEVAGLLGNTTAVCRDYYIHPGLIDAYLDGRFPAAWREHLAEVDSGLEPEEHATLQFLRVLVHTGVEE